MEKNGRKLKNNKEKLDLFFASPVIIEKFIEN